MKTTETLIYHCGVLNLHLGALEGLLKISSWIKSSLGKLSLHLRLYLYLYGEL